MRAVWMVRSTVLAAAGNNSSEMEMQLGALVDSGQSGNEIHVKLMAESMKGAPECWQ